MSHAPVFDTVVIGAGIAGPCAALALARRGFRVVLLEAVRLPRHKVCGEFLSPESQAILERLGARQAIENAGATTVAKSRITAATGVSVEIPLSGPGLALSRYRLDHTLWELARAAGVQCYGATKVRRVSGGLAAGFTITTASSSFYARTVIAASGRHAAYLDKPRPEYSPLIAHQFLGIKAHFEGVNIPPGVVELFGWGGGYCGVVQVEEGIANVCLLARYEAVKNQAERTPKALWQWARQRCPPLARCVAGAMPRIPWLATGNVTFGTIYPATGDVLRCGDAAGFINPLTGDGMAMAARSGELAAAVIAGYLRGDLDAADMAPLYDAAWRREFTHRLRWAGALQPLLMSPLLTTPAVALLARSPRLAQWAVANTRGA